MVSGGIEREGDYFGGDLMDRSFGRGQKWLGAKEGGGQIFVRNLGHWDERKWWQNEGRTFWGKFPQIN
jgi:hypothetical protein